MIYLTSGIILRILSNSYLNVFQKILTNNGEKSSVVNFYTYLGLTLIGIIVSPVPDFNREILYNALSMGLLGALGNYFIIKSLSCGDLSSVAPINSYKPIVALLLGALYLKEIPAASAILGILFIIGGTFVFTKPVFLLSKACKYRIYALIFSATEAIFIKKIILLTNIQSTFLYWALAGLIFSLIIAFNHPLRISKTNIKFQVLLITAVAVMQYSTNYVFSKINVAYALALFQLSTLLSVYLGASIFKETDLKKKIIGSIIMILGACLIILS